LIPEWWMGSKKERWVVFPGLSIYRKNKKNNPENETAFFHKEMIATI